MKTRTATYLALLIVLFAAALPVAGQEPATFEELCTPSAFANLLRNIADDMEEDGPDLMGSLWATLTGLHMMQAACSDLMFTGRGNEVVGPFTLPAGNYRVDGRFDAFYTAEFSTLTRDCELDFLVKMMVATSLNGGSDNLLLRTDQECQVAVEINTTDDWTLTFSPLS